MATSAPPVTPSRWLALTVLCAGQLMIILDQTIVNVALPVIQLDLGFTQANLAWVINAYVIVFGGLLLLAGRLSDLVGRKQVFLAGLALFTVASALCGLAWTSDLLVAARFIQGIGGAATSAVILAMVVTMFPDGAGRAKAIAIFSFASAAGASVGPLAGGLLVKALNWHWIFYINVPIGIVIVVLAMRILEPERGTGFGAGADYVGAMLVTAGLMLGVYTIVQVPENGWSSLRTVLLGVGSLVLLAGFVFRQAAARQPLIPLRIFRSRNLSGANVVQALMIAGMFGFLFLGTLYLQRVLGYNPLETGLAFMPVAIVIAIIQLGLSAPLVTRFGAKTVLLVGLGFIVAGLLLLSRVPVDGVYLVDFLPATMLLAIGFGTAMPALTMLAMSGSSPQDSGLASGLFNTTQQVGGALGLAVLSTLAASRTGGLETPGAVAGGYRLAFVVGAMIVAAGLVLAAVVLRALPEPAQGAAEDEVTEPAQAAAAG